MYERPFAIWEMQAYTKLITFNHRVELVCQERHAMLPF
jgi:hypothetical protein